MLGDWYKQLKDRVNRTDDYIELRDKTNIPVFLYDDFFVPEDLTNSIFHLGKGISFRNDLILKKKYLDQIKAKGPGYLSVHCRAATQCSNIYEGRIEGNVFLVSYHTILFLDDWYQNNSIFVRKKSYIRLTEQKIVPSDPKLKPHDPLIECHMYIVPTMIITEMDMNMVENSYFLAGQKKERVYFKSDIFRSRY